MKIDTQIVEFMNTLVVLLKEFRENDILTYSLGWNKLNVELTYPGLEGSTGSILFDHKNSNVELHVKAPTDVLEFIFDESFDESFFKKEVLSAFTEWQDELPELKLQGSWDNDKFSITSDIPEGKNFKAYMAIRKPYFGNMFIEIKTVVPFTLVKLIYKLLQQS